MKKIQIIAIISTVLFLNIFSFSKVDENWIRKPLKFTRTQRTLTVKGVVTANKLVHCYVFKGKRNQRVIADITSDQNNALLDLSEQEGDPASYTQAPDGSSWVHDYSGVLQTNTIYEVCVKSDRGKSNYTLQVTLE